MKPHEGSIFVLNLDSVKKSRAIQSSIGYMPQKFGLYEDLTVRETWSFTPACTASPARTGKNASAASSP